MIIDYLERVDMLINQFFNDFSEFCQNNELFNLADKFRVKLTIISGISEIGHNSERREIGKNSSILKRVSCHLGHPEDASQSSRVRYRPLKDGEMPPPLHLKGARGTY